MENTTEKNITGLETATNRKEAEYDLVKSLLTAMNYQTDENAITEAEIKRKGTYLFSVNLHPISDEQIRVARKKATVYMPNPNNKKLPPIEKDVNNAKLKSMIIYLATTEEDQKKIWGNQAVMEKAGIMEPYESVDVLLTAGEKSRLVDLIMEISGMDDEDEGMDEEEYAKN